MRCERGCHTGRCRARARGRERDVMWSMKSSIKESTSAPGESARSGQEKKKGGGRGADHHSLPATRMVRLHRGLHRGGQNPNKIGGGYVKKKRKVK